MKEWFNARLLAIVVIVIVVLTFTALFAYAHTTTSRWAFEDLGRDRDTWPYSEIKIVGPDELHVVQSGIVDGRYSLVYSAWASGKPDSTPIYIFNISHSFRAASMVVDSEGHVHIFMALDILGAQYDGIWYANDSNGAWTFTRLDIDDNVLDLRAAIDAAGKFHLIYAQNLWEPSNANDVMYATNANGGWVASMVYECPPDTYASICGLASDGQGVLRTVFGVANYHTYNDIELEHAVLSEGSWTVSEILTSYKVVGRPSMVVGEDGTAHVGLLMSDGSTFSLAHASCHDGVWDLETIVEAGNRWPCRTAIALGQGDEIHISYYRHYFFDFNAAGNDYSFWYAKKTAGSWSVERVSSAYSVSGYSETSIAVDSEGNGHMIFSRLNDRGYSQWTCTAKKTSQGVLGESLTEALRNTALLVVPPSVVTAVAYVVVGVRRRQNDRRQKREDEAGLWDRR
ncbi:MAG: hypothetical protein JW880_04265 [Candidatus Thermoplasmatota archaeon]|nr:hypothetical protein [Candidatus Thermoplasmatota archaeon]